MFTNQGRLKHTTKETCPECNRGKLQLRIRESVQTIVDKVKRIDYSEIVDEVEYLVCPVCEYERDVKLQGKKKRKVDDF